MAEKIPDSTPNATLEHWMQHALDQARLAGAAGEIPVGAVVVRHGQVLARGQNAPVGAHDPTAHAEVVALRAAALAVGNYRLTDCELYVTLEPCAMCAGAILHARLKRVVFAAFDAKTGAAGSVINLFTQPQLNHHTAVQGGVMAAHSTALLQHFFHQRRLAQRLAAKASHPLREDALRVCDSAFAGLPDYPWPPNYISDLPALAGLRLHYLDAGKNPAHADQSTYICLHTSPDWSYAYRQLIPIFLRAGHRVIAPDLIGFGKSDKPKKASFHSTNAHRQILLELVERLRLKNTVWVAQSWDKPLGLVLPEAALQTESYVLASKFLANTGAAGHTNNIGHTSGAVNGVDSAAYNAAFPDAGHRAAIGAFALLR